MSLSTTSPPIVVDAGFAVQAVLPVASPVDVIDQMVRWRNSGLRLVAPMLWLAECASAVRTPVHSRLISIEHGQVALEDVLAIDVEALPITVERVRAAFGWAIRLGQRRVYDGFYLALADELQAEFWTADRRLANSVRHLGLAWVHLIDEIVEPG